MRSILLLILLAGCSHPASEPVDTPWIAYCARYNAGCDPGPVPSPL